MIHRPPPNVLHTESRQNSPSTFVRVDLVRLAADFAVLYDDPMPPLNSLKVLYATFDEIPGPKGASTHVLANVAALAAAGANIWLVTPGREDCDETLLDCGVRQIVLGCPDGNPIGRARTFREKLVHWLLPRSFDVLHVRSIFEGIPLVDPQARRSSKLLYEVNGFPSIELKYHYANLIDNRQLLDKLARQELDLLAAADRVVTVSQVNQTEIEERGVSPERIRLIRNGVDTQLFPFQSPVDVGEGPVEIAYVGTLATWQGVEVLIEAAGLLRRERSVRLRLLGPASRTRRAELERLVRRLRLDDVVEFLGTGTQGDVARLLHASHLTAVPLLPVDRNTQQGCCPLKLLEAMAAGCPVVASDLPVIRELATPELEVLLVRPQDARHLKNAITRLIESPGLAQSLAQAARMRVEREGTWTRATQELVDCYRELIAS